MQLTTFSVFGLLFGLKQAGAPFDQDALFWGVFSGITDRGLATQLSDLILPDHVIGQGAAFLGWSGVYTESDGSTVIDSDPTSFRGDDSTITRTVIGWFLSDASLAGNLICFAYLPRPALISYPGPVLTVVARLLCSPNHQWDASLSWSGQIDS